MNTIPTTIELYNGIITDLEAELGIPIPDEGKTMLRALAGVQAGKLKMFYLAIGELQKNIWVDLADPVAVGGTLERFGFTKLGRYPYPATDGVYTATVTGTLGATIPALTQFKSDDDSLNPGYLFILDNAHTLTGTTDSISIRALTAGLESLLAIADTLTATAPLLNVNQNIVITAITTNPVAAETIEQYRQKAIQAYQLTPQGGAPADYRLWGLDAQGTRQIYPYATSGSPNEVDIYVEALPADSVPVNTGIPTGTILTDVYDDIIADPDTGVGRKPLAVFAVNVYPIDALDVDITIDSGGTITVPQQALIQAAVEEWAYNIRPFIAGIDNAALRNDTISTFGIGSVVIDTIGGAIISSITMDVDGTPETSYQFDNGQIPYITTITFI